MAIPDKSKWLDLIFDWAEQNDGAARMLKEGMDPHAVFAALIETSPAFIDFVIERKEEPEEEPEAETETEEEDNIIYLENWTPTGRPN